MIDSNKPAIKLRHISIRNYKGIDSLDLDFPEPRMPGDPDVLVMGSENGLGKTSVLECCALLLLALELGETEVDVFDRHSRIDIPELLIRAGAKSAEISGVFVLADGSEIHPTFVMRRDGLAYLKGARVRASTKSETWERRRVAEDSLKTILGLSPGPVLSESFLMFHSYRKVQEGNPELRMLVERDESQRGNYRLYDKSQLSEFKLHMLRAMMGQARLFEFDAELGEGVEDSVRKLNGLVSTYADGTLGKLRPSPDNSFQFMIHPNAGGAPFAFDGLSSGQKEIISTLFLTWYHTRNKPTVVLIDEPELHLNAQWHRSFVKSLFSIAPDNQYIMATHSEHIMDSVDGDRRILLSAAPETVG